MRQLFWRVLRYFRTRKQSIQLLDEMLTGFALCKMVFDANGVPIDFIYLDVNKAFERITELKRENVLGKKVSEVLPALEHIWIEKYGAVVLTGVPDCFEHEVKSIDQHLLVAAYRPYEGHFAVTFYQTSQVHQLQRELEHAYEETIIGWAHAIDVHDHETYGHSLRSAKMACDLADALNYAISNGARKDFFRGALLHDVGKIGIPDSIRLKAASLTDDERKIVQLHTNLAKALLEPIAYLRPSIDIPYYHHERWDGTGYPEGLKGDSIPFAARLFAVVDVWDALRSDRPYRAAFDRDTALKVIVDGSGTLFDPSVVVAFVKLLKEIGRAHV